MAFWSLGALRTLLDTETDANSPGSEELMSQIRENIEALFLVLLGTGVQGAVDSVSGAVLTDTGNFVASAHVGRTLVIISGSAKGNMYTIDANDANSLTCTGDNLETDGVAAADVYLILHDVKVNADGHDHDGVNSKRVILGDYGGGALASTGHYDATAIVAYDAADYYVAFPIYIPATVTSLSMRVRFRTSNASYTAYVKLVVAAQTAEVTTTSAAWVNSESSDLDVSALSGSQIAYVQWKISNGAGECQVESVILYDKSG